jgi:hypothetical protein
MKNTKAAALESAGTDLFHSIQKMLTESLETIASNDKKLYVFLINTQAGIVFRDNLSIFLYNSYAPKADWHKTSSYNFLHTSPAQAEATHKLLSNEAFTSALLDELSVKITLVIPQAVYVKITFEKIS